MAAANAILYTLRSVCRLIFSLIDLAGLKLGSKSQSLRSESLDLLAEKHGRLDHGVDEGAKASALCLRLAGNVRHHCAVCELNARAGTIDQQFGGERGQDLVLLLEQELLEIHDAAELAPIGQ